MPNATLIDYATQVQSYNAAHGRHWPVPPLAYCSARWIAQCRAWTALLEQLHKRDQSEADPATELDVESMHEEAQELEGKSSPRGLGQRFGLPEAWDLSSLYTCELERRPQILAALAGMASVAYWSWLHHMRL